MIMSSLVCPVEGLWAVDADATLAECSGVTFVTRMVFDADVNSQHPSDPSDPIAFML
jgi:hypothetical protein